MDDSHIEFSAQFGGRDAAAALLPHFKALKAAGRNLSISGFPFASLAFLLRVDGEVNQYRLSGAGNLQVNPNGDYLSIDIGILLNDRNKLVDVLTAAILSSSAIIQEASVKLSLRMDLDSLRGRLSELTTRYKHEISNH